MNSTIDLDELTVMQDELRHNSQIESMVNFVKEGGFWTTDVLNNFAKNQGLKRICPLMEIVQFPDSRLMIHDGHHRGVSIYLGGRNFVRGDEYVLKHWDYEDYLGINFDHRWVTPFDPRIQVRIPDISNFKNKAFELFEQDREIAIKFIRENQGKYTKPRLISGIDCLARRYLQFGHSSSGVVEDELQC